MLRYDEEELLPISALAHLLFCERRAALVYIDGLWAENEFTARGMLEHERVHQIGTEVRGDVVTARGLRLRSLRLGLTGQADAVEFQRDTGEGSLSGVALRGREGLWQPVPVEYKSGRKRSETGYEVQLCAQAMCLEEMLSISIERGALYYGGSERRVEIRLTLELRGRTESAALRLHALLASREIPPSEIGRKCQSCSLADKCLPGTASRHDVASYLRDAILIEDEADP